MKRVLLLLFTVALTFSLSAQSMKAYRKAAEKASYEKDYSAAVGYYKIILDEAGNKDTENLYNGAESARKFRVYKLAEAYYQKVLEREDASKFPLAMFYLADVKKRQGKYDEATQLYDNFAANAKDVAPEYINKAKFESASAIWAKDQVANGDSLGIDAYKDRVNTCNSEFAPYFQDGKLYYSSLRFVDEETNVKTPFSRALSYDEANNGPDGELLDEAVNKELKHVAHTVFNPSGKRMYFTLCDSKNASEVVCDIYYRDMQDDGNWGPVSSAGNGVNDDAGTTTQPAVGMDPASGNDILYFSSNRSGGNGGMDLYAVSVNADGSFGTPENLDSLNTEEDDVTPFYDTRTDLLYFSSTGRQNMGGFDIYSAKYLGNGNWDAVNHEGYPLNSSYDDMYFVKSNEAQKAFFSSNRPGGVVCGDSLTECICNDIYYFNTKIEVDLLVTTWHKILNTPLEQVIVNLYNLTSGETVELPVEDIHRYTSTLELDQDYMVVGSRDGWRPDTVYFDTRNIVESQTIEKELFLEPDVELEALTFDEITLKELYGCSVDLYEKTLTGSYIMIDSRPENNDYIALFDISLGKEYMVVAAKENYSSDTAYVTEALDIAAIQGPTTITKELFLLQDDVPPLLLPLYFDNDRPDPRTLSLTTNTTDEETYEAYYKRKGYYMDQFPEGSAERDSLDEFFEIDVKGGYERLDEFTTYLQRYLASGKQIQIIFRGYASPRARSTYNEKLSTRRIDCIRNYFEAVTLEGRRVFEPYIASRQLTIVEEPFGERKAKDGAVDETVDEKRSIYSHKAARERRVEIVEIISNSQSF